MPLYEYACATCAAVFSRLRPFADAGESAPCPHCDALAARTLTSFAVLQRAETPQPATPPPTSQRPLCQRYPHIPLVCHMEPDAAERWVAKAEGREEQYLEREARRQEAAARVGVAPSPAPALEHRHHFGHVHPGHTDTKPASG
ncbi:MAG: FmdB family zinc ribbon protein [Dehalococcoidia bacterium]